MDVLVVGAGAMGRWFARTVAGPDDAVAFDDADDDAARAAVRAVDGHVGSATVADETATATVVCLAVPLPAARSAIEAHAHRAEAALCDVTGSMRDPVAAMAGAAPDCERASLHPLFAPERGTGRIATVVDAGGPTVDAVLDQLRAAGNEVFETTPAAHDEAMETVQARAHAAVFAFAMAAEDVPDQFHTPVSRTLFDLVETVTSGDPRVYADIQQAFDGADDVAEAADALARADDTTFAEIYERLG